jgi:Ecdysteroid kinase-like family
MHAISMAIKVAEPEKFREKIGKMREVVFTESASRYYSDVLDWTLDGVIESLVNFSNPNGELDEPIKILQRLKGEQLYSIMTNHVVESNDEWKVLCHGDLWINNLMFHYHNGKPKHVKFVDLQTIRHTNLSCDILMFLYSSTEAELRHNHLDCLLTIYRESLISNLREYLEKNFSLELATLEEEFTFESIKKEFAIRSLYGLGTSLWVMPAITFKSLKDEFEAFGAAEKKSTQPKEFHNRVRDIVKEFYDRGFLDNIFIDI